MNRRLLFVTTSLGTKWESYSQALIELGFPKGKRLVLDGTRNWFPLMFLESALAHDSDYTIHIDEDCFLFDPTQLDHLISRMDEQDNVVMAGVPDGGNYYREHNPYACNLFFLVFKTKAIRELLKSNPDWMNFKFRETFKSGSDLDLSALNESRIRYDDYEPYYGLFWAILENGNRIIYLKSVVDSALLSTDVRFGSESVPMARHMWYLRSWDMAELGPHDKIPHRVRYQRLEQQILSLFGNELRFKRQLAIDNSKRLAKKLVRRAARRMSNAPGALLRRVLIITRQVRR
jgi:hypothetical protein